MRTMLALALLFAAWGSTTRADDALPPVPEGLKLVMAGACTDTVTKERGRCATLVDVTGTVYVVFVQNQTVQFIRKMSEDGYEEIYTSPHFSTY